MPVRVMKVKGGYKVSHGGKTSAKKTTKAKALKQERLLNAVSHTSWRPTGKKGKGRKKS